MSASAGLRLKGLRVLLADPRPYSRSLIRSMLLPLETKAIHEVNDGAAALETINSVTLDVVIVDWDLPVVRVPDLLRMVRSSNAHPNPDVPFIVISSQPSTEQVSQAIELGAQQFMVRPISPRMLEQRLRTVMMPARPAARVLGG